jgi:hypothetical protein
MGAFSSHEGGDHRDVTDFPDLTCLEDSNDAGGSKPVWSTSWTTYPTTDQNQRVVSV